MLVGEALRRRMPVTEEAVSISDFDGSLNLWLDLSEHMQSQIYWYGYYSFDLVPLFKRVLVPGAVVVDGGANIGELSLIAGKLVGRRGHVFAFEPIQEIADRLQANVYSNHFSNVTVIRRGLSREAGRAPIYQAAGKSDDGLWNKGLGTLYSDAERSALAGTIELTSLDAFAEEQRLARLDLLKLDIEGGELPALLGAREVLARFSPDLIIELNERMCANAGYTMTELLGFLTSANYQICRIGRRGTLTPLRVADLRPFQNLYCVHRVRAAMMPSLRGSWTS